MARKNKDQKGSASTKSTASEVKKMPSKATYFLKDFLLAIVLLLLTFYFVQGSFYTKDKVKEYEDKVKAALRSRRVSNEDKNRIKKERENNLNLLKRNWGYFFVYDNLLRRNYETIIKYPTLDYENKIYSKSGALGYLLHKIKQATPDTAVIIFPLTDENINNPKFSFTFNKKETVIPGIQKRKKYFNWFVYPRKIVWLTEKDKDELKNATHVFIFNGKGGEFAQIPENNKIYNYRLYPIKKN